MIMAAFARLVVGIASAQRPALEPMMVGAAARAGSGMASSSSSFSPRTAGGRWLPPAEGRARASAALPREHFSRFPGRTACGPPRAHLPKARDAWRQVARDVVFLCLGSGTLETGVAR